MAFARTEYTGNGATTTYAIGFTFLRTAYLRVFLDGIEQDNTIDWNLDGGETNVVFVVAPGNGDEILIYRDTSRTTRIVDWEGGARITESDLDDSDSQLFHIMQELDDGGGGAALESALDAAASATEAAASEVAAAASAALYLGMGTLDSLTDVNTAGVVNGDALVYSGGVWGPGEPSVLELGDLTDVDTTGQASGDVLGYDGSDWVPVTAAATGFPGDYKTSKSNVLATVATETECTVTIPATGSWRIKVLGILLGNIQIGNGANGSSEIIALIDQKVGAAAYATANQSRRAMSNNAHAGAGDFDGPVTCQHVVLAATNGEVYKYQIRPVINDTGAGFTGFLNSDDPFNAGGRRHTLSVDVLPNS